MQLDPEADSILQSTLSIDPLLLLSPVWEISLGLVSILVLLLCSALISGSEVAYFSLTPNDTDRLEQDTDAHNRRLLWLIERPRKLLATILISNNFINIAIVLLSEIIVLRILPDKTTQSWAYSLQQGWSYLQRFTEDQLALIMTFLITVVGVTFLLVLFGEVAPKVYARFNHIRLARFMSGPLTLLMQFFTPLSMLLVNWSNRLEKRLQDKTPASGLTSREDIDEAIELTVSHEEDSNQDMDILKRIVKFTDVSVRQIMRSRVDVVAIDERSSYQEVLALIRESGYSRLPVYENDADSVVGILYVKDLLGHLQQAADFKWQELIRTNVLFVPESKKINDLLKEFQQQRLHMAIVVDEYGGTAGIVTLEDILEEVIGDIQDEFDDEPEILFQKVDNLNYVFDGKTMLNDLYRITGLESPVFELVKGDADSLAGLILEVVGELPEFDQELDIEGYRFKIVSVTDRRIERILLTLPNPSEEN